MKRIFLLLLLSTYLFSIENMDVTSKTPLSSQQEGLISKTSETFNNWPEMSVQKTNLVFEEEHLSIILELESLIYKGIEISQYMPSGLQFYYDTFYEYDFRMFKDGLFMRLKGQYYSKEEFLEELYQAVQNPMLYIQVHDPSYLIRQIDLIREDNKKQDREISDLLTSYTDLLEKHNLLIKDYTQLLDKHQKLNTGVISLNNKNFFGSLDQFDNKYIELVQNLKIKSPKLNVKDLGKLLKDQGTPVPEKVIEAVFIIYFEEFPQNK